MVANLGHVMPRRGGFIEESGAIYNGACVSGIGVAKVWCRHHRWRGPRYTLVRAVAHHDTSKIVLAICRGLGKSVFAVEEKPGTGARDKVEAHVH